ncbi:shikimate kinase [Rubinisphaera italica]|uniref:Shikimate kinase n=1 Tax=Rubinisphaera italica TaxID=2527969 RepID=A0A5C5XDN6_9PLAN|nr:shikimate kinase [Rubinisphaera italica]TWT60235.1 Shikimate kinase 2 [Rubinisphaera italica]
MIVSLIGYRGCGKSSLAPLIAERLHWRAVDSDRLIEEQAGCTIADIFKSHGEPEFRKIEAEILAQLFNEDQLVIATGGGAILNSQTCELMRHAGPVFWLSAPTEELIRRLTQDVSTTETRPALTDLKFEEEIRTVLQNRIPVYQAVSDFEVSTAGRTLTDLVDDILQLIQGWTPQSRTAIKEHTS